MASAATEVLNQNQTDGYGTTGGNLFRGNERPADDDIPINAVFVVPGAAAVAPEAVSGDMAAIAYGPIQVVIRNHIFDDAQTKAINIYKALAAADFSGTIGHTMEQGYPVYLGEDTQRVYRFTINLTLIQNAADLNPVSISWFNPTLWMFYLDE